MQCRTTFRARISEAVQQQSQIVWCEKEGLKWIAQRGALCQCVGREHFEKWKQ